MYLYLLVGSKLSCSRERLSDMIGYYSKKNKSNVIFEMSFISFTCSNRFSTEDNNDCGDSGDN